MHIIAGKDKDVQIRTYKQGLKSNGKLRYLLLGQSGADTGGEGGPLASKKEEEGRRRREKGREGEREKRKEREMQLKVIHPTTRTTYTFLSI